MEKTAEYTQFMEMRAACLLSQLVRWILATALHIVAWNGRLVPLMKTDWLTLAA